VVVSNEMSKLNPDRNAVASAASAAAPLAQRIAERLATMQYDQAVVLRILQRIPDDAENIALAMSALRNKQSWRSIRSICL